MPASYLVLFISIGLIAGALAGRVVCYHGYGVFGEVVDNQFARLYVLP